MINLTESSQNWQIQNDGWLLRLQFLRRSVDGKRLIHFQSETTGLNFSGAFWTAPQANDEYFFDSSDFLVTAYCGFTTRAEGELLFN